MRLFNWFKKPERLICGGKSSLEIIDSNKSVVGVLYYRRPSYEEIIEYEHAYFSEIENEFDLKEISEDKNKVKKIHSVVVKEIFIPFAEKIFAGSSGYLDENKKPIESRPVKEQFELIKKYYGYHLVELVAYAFKANSICKKKD